MVHSFLLCVLVLCSCFSKAQTMTDFFSSSALDVAMVGIDYSEVKLVGAEGFSDPPKIQSYYFGAWNGLLISEIDKYDVKSAFSKKNIHYHLNIVEKGNLAVDYINLVTNVTPPFFTNEKLQEIISRYNCETIEAPFGISLVAHSLNKLQERAYYYVVIFNPKTKQILFSEKISGDAGGFGFRNYWARSYYNVLNEIKKSKFRKWKKEATRK